ncbi:uncharacterized protein LOC144953660 [Lampetra fluviatilis]
MEEERLFEVQRIARAKCRTEEKCFRDYLLKKRLIQVKYLIDDKHHLEMKCPEENNLEEEEEKCLANGPIAPSFGEECFKAEKMEKKTEVEQEEEKVVEESIVAILLIVISVSTISERRYPAVAAALLGPATLAAEPAPSPQAAGGASGDGPPTSETEPSLREVYAAIRGLAEQRDQPPRRWQPPLQHRAEPPRRNAPWVCHRCGREGHVARGCRTEPEAANVTWNLPGPNADRSQASDAVPPGLSGGPGNYTSDAANSPGVSSGWAPVVSFPGPRCSGRGKGIAPGPVVASRPGVASRTDVTLRPEVTSRSEGVSRIAPGIAPGPWTAPGIAPGPGTASGIAPRPGTAPGVAPTPGGTSRTEHPM